MRGDYKETSDGHVQRKHTPLLLVADGHCCLFSILLARCCHNLRVETSVSVGEGGGCCSSPISVLVSLGVSFILVRHRSKGMQPMARGYTYMGT